MSYPTLESTIGNTPLVRLQRLPGDTGNTLLVKLEGNNPAGSVKDRPAYSMIRQAEARGEIRPGDTLIEATSGNTGIALAMVAAIKGYRAVLCMPDKVSSEKVNLLKAFGAEVLLSPTAVAPDSPESYYSVARRIAAERPGTFFANQYFNPANPQAHYQTTGPELWQQTAGKITHFVAGMGTGGTISGTARYLKEKDRGVRVIGADPVGSILKHYHETHEMSEPHTYKIEGVGEDFIPGATDFALIDQVIACTDRDGLNTARRLAREEALFTGGSGGMATWVALQVAKGLPAESLVVVILPDTGERYLSKVHNDEWMRDNHLLDPSATSAKDLVGSKSRGLPALMSVQAGESLKRALALVEQHNVTQIPVFRGSELVGTLYDNDILRAALADPTALEKPVEGWMSDPLPVVASGDPLERVTRTRVELRAVRRD